MQQIEIDLSALEERIQNDSILHELDEAKQKWVSKQEEKRKRYESKIGQNQNAIKEKQQQISALKREIKKLKGEIGRFQCFARFRSEGLRRIESRIRVRKNHLRFVEVKKATALAQKRVSQLLKLNHP